VAGLIIKMSHPTRKIVNIPTTNMLRRPRTLNDHGGYDDEDENDANCKHNENTSRLLPEEGNE
jgi:hypothetical protein